MSDHAAKLETLTALVQSLLDGYQEQTKVLMQWTREGRDWVAAGETMLAGVESNSRRLAAINEQLKENTRAIEADAAARNDDPADFWKNGDDDGN